MNSAVMARQAALAMMALVASVASQDIYPCERYDLNTGKGTCNGIAVDIGNVLCVGERE